MIKALNVERRERGGGAIFYICPNIENTERVFDSFKNDRMYTHLEVYCSTVKQPETKMEVIAQ